LLEVVIVGGPVDGVTVVMEHAVGKDTQRFHTWLDSPSRKGSSLHTDIRIALIGFAND